MTVSTIDDRPFTLNVLRILHGCPVVETSTYVTAAAAIYAANDAAQSYGFVNGGVTDERTGKELLDLS